MSLVDSVAAPEARMECWFGHGCYRNHRIIVGTMVRDGYIYGLSFLAVAAVAQVGDGQLGVGHCAGAAGGVFSMVFPRSPAHGSCRSGVDCVAGRRPGHRDSHHRHSRGPRQRISIFLSVFDVHVNRSPIGGVLSSVRYQKGQYLNAMNPASADRNEQNMVTVRGEGIEVTFKQIAGLLARRIVFNFSEGDTVERGQRVGLIKFGSRVDVLLPAEADSAREGGAAGEGRIERAGGHGPTETALMNGRDLEPGPGPKQRPACAAACICCPRCLPRATSPPATFPSLRPSRRSAGNAHTHLDWAAIAILFAIPFDALDGRIARMTNTTSEFGKELDSLADAITFGVAPSLLALIWGFHFLPDSINPQLQQHLHAGRGVHLLPVSHRRGVAIDRKRHQQSGKQGREVEFRSAPPFP